jgi:large subunit ribosomal protein L35
MSKLKTKKGVAKRFKLTKKRKIKYVPCGKGHLLSEKKPGRLRRLRRGQLVESSKDIKFLKRMLPYG